MNMNVDNRDTEIDDMDIHAGLETDPESVAEVLGLAELMEETEAVV